MDKKARDILFKIYWTSAGWINEDQRVIDPLDFDYARSKGVMFDPFSISKSELLDKLKELLYKISKEDISNAFLRSLTTKQFELRSAIASYANAIRVINGMTVDSFDLQDEYIDQDLNILNFERLKWAGVRHSQVLYNYFDLLLFSKLQIEKPTQGDFEIFSKILRTISESQTGDYPSKLRDRLKEVYKSSKDERKAQIEKRYSSLPNNKIGNLLSPLFLTGLWTLGTGIHFFTRDPGEEGVGYLAALMTCLFSIPPFVLSFIIKRSVKAWKKSLFIQIPTAIFILWLYWKWSVIMF